MATFCRHFVAKKRGIRVRDIVWGEGVHSKISCSNSKALFDLVLFQPSKEFLVKGSDPMMLGLVTELDIENRNL